MGRVKGISIGKTRGLSSNVDFALCTSGSATAVPTDRKGCQLLADVSAFPTRSCRAATQGLLIAQPAVHARVRGGLARRPICARRPCTTLSWYHHVALLDKLHDPELHIWYGVKAAQNGWSRDVRVYQIEGRLGGRSARRGAPLQVGHERASQPAASNVQLSGSVAAAVGPERPPTASARCRMQVGHQCSSRREPLPA